MNEYDSNRIYDLTSMIGYTKTDKKEEADCFVLNTCHIREKATEKVYHEIGRVKKIFKNLKKPTVVISGCVAQAESEEMLKRELLENRPYSRPHAVAQVFGERKEAPVRPTGLNGSKLGSHLGACLYIQYGKFS